MRQVTDIHEIQGMALGLLKQFDRFCAEHRLEYTLAYGTLIGAIRHGGFIPWDDDIDLWMKRKDYDRFLEEFPAWGEREGLYLNSPRTVEKHYNRIHSQICLANTKLVAGNRNNDYPEGCFIDVFPIDGSPNNPALRWLRLTHLQLLKAIGTAAAYKNYRSDTLKGKLMGMAAPVFRGLDTSKLMDRYGRLAAASDVDKSDYVQVTYAFLNGRNLLMPRALFDRTVKKPFETMTASVPAEYDRILRDLYGDYMVPPPPEKQVTHHDYELFVEDDGAKCPETEGMC